MSSDDRKAPAPAPRTDKKDAKIADLPKPNRTAKDDEVKGGLRVKALKRDPSIAG